MSFTGRIRLFLIFIAVFPPLVIMAVIYFSLIKQTETIERQQAYANLQKYHPFYLSLQGDLQSGVNQLISSAEFKTELFQLKADRNSQIELNPQSFGLDFLEIADSNLIVKATFHRPGLLGTEINSVSSNNNSIINEMVEYDFNGAHAAFTILYPVDGNYYIYTGRYIDSKLRQQLQQLLGGLISLHIDIDTNTIFSRMEKFSLYKTEDNYSALLAGSKDADFYLTASFTVGESIQISNSLLNITIIVALISIVIAIFLGVFITGRAKREIDNLVSATSRVARGDFSTPVMAYEEGEFSQLADSFSEMMRRLKVLRQQLATTEKIAAWQTVSRKIAHEIKNPLSPISISADDLRRAYYEKLPDFEKTLEETTSTIKSEMGRLTTLLDEFVSFARMKQPDIVETKLESLINDLQLIYKNEIESNILIIEENYSDKTNYRIDPDLIKQTLINLIKNGFEASQTSKVTLRIKSDDNNLILAIEDTGPGFSREKLADSFEPYVTTKPDGTGLGLVICHRIVHDHNGTMELYNRPEGGAGVRIILPR